MPDAARPTRVLYVEGKTASIEKAMAHSGEYYRMQTFNQALGAATNPGDLRLLIKGVTSGSATATAPVAVSAAPQGDTGRIKISRGF